MIKTSVYIDGFNLYYGSLKDTPYRWLDLGAFCNALLPKHTIMSIKFFSAKLTPRPHNEGQLLRQAMYWRALGTIPHLSIIEGHFLTKETLMTKVPIHPEDILESVRVFKTEEKGSDVNLATHMVHDSHRRSYECAIVLSNDSDLAEPIRIVRQKLQLPIGIINPHKRMSKTLLPLPTFTKTVRTSVLKHNQFPQTIADQHGVIHKPKGW